MSVIGRNKKRPGGCVADLVVEPVRAVQHPAKAGAWVRRRSDAELDLAALGIDGHDVACRRLAHDELAAVLAAHDESGAAGHVVEPGNGVAHGSSLRVCPALVPLF